MIAANAIIVAIPAKHMPAIIFIELMPSASALRDINRNDAFSVFVTIPIISHQTKP